MVKDILISETNGDLLFKGGDLDFGDSDDQHILLIINTFVGSWKQFPTCGIGIIKYLVSGGQGAVLKRDINIQLQADGYSDVFVSLTENPNGFFDYKINAIRT